MSKMRDEDLALVRSGVRERLRWNGDYDYVHAALIGHIDHLEDELRKYRTPVQETVALNMATVVRLLEAAGWHNHNAGVGFNRGLERMTITYTNGVFRWAWKDGQRIDNFNDLLTVRK